MNCKQTNTEIKFWLSILVINESVFVKRQSFFHELVCLWWIKCQLRCKQTNTEISRGTSFLHVCYILWVFCAMVYGRHMVSVLYWQGEIFHWCNCWLLFSLSSFYRKNKSIKMILLNILWFKGVDLQILIVGWCKLCLVA